MNLNPQKGFSLIEVMIVVAIVAIIAAIALPSYQDSIRKSRRNDAKSAITEIAALQEKYYFKNNKYSSDVSALYGSAASKDGYYTVSLDMSGCSDNQCFTAKAVTVGSQADDKSCKTFTLSHTGLRKAEDDGGADATSTCW